ncbi:MAG: ABC transporter substrate-binding protein [Alphaproteobacteria bacterium]|nr:ABC transporter substrate-binding protein [Alphaproteobacteria bacterium]
MIAKWLSTAALIALAAFVAPSAQAQGQTPNTAVSGTITLVAYAGIFQDNYVATVVEPFQRHFPNVRVNYFPGGTSAQMLGTARAQRNDPQTDVIIMDASVSMIGNGEGLFERLTPADVPSLNELFPEARAAGGEFGPAVTFDHLVLVYDTQRVQPPLTTLRQLWDPSLRGQLGVSAPPNIQGLALTVMVAKMEGADYRQTIDPAIRRLRELAPSVQTFDPSPDGYTLILNGAIRVATGWNARAQLIHDQSQGRLGVLLPPEGSVYQINTINVTRGGRNRAAALAFTNYALGQEAQKAFTERMFYGPTNARAQISPAALARTAASPENQARMIPVDWSWMATVRDQWNNRWRREVIAAGSR